VIVDDPPIESDRSRFKRTDKLDKCKRVFGKWLVSLCVHIELIRSMHWIFQCLFKLIGRAHKLQHILSRDSFSSLTDVSHKVLFPLFPTTNVGSGVLSYKFEHICW